MVAWIKIDPKFPGESPYDQMLKKEIDGDKIILTWRLTAKNLQRAGEISVQIIFASPEYFVEDELDNILGDSLMLPSVVQGSSAPVWQSFPETFVIEESISNTEGYKEITKNVLVAAVAEAALSAQTARESAEAAMQAEEAATLSEESASYIHDNVQNIQELIASDYDSIKEIKAQMEQNLEASSQYLKAAEEKANEAQASCESAFDYCLETYDYREETLIARNDSQESANYANREAQKAVAARESARKALSAVKRARNFRLIHKQTLTAEDTDCYSFEVSLDTEGNALSLSEFVIFMYFPMMENAGSGYVRVNILPDDSTVTTFQNIAQFAALSNTKDMYLRSEHKNMGRWVTNFVSGDGWTQSAQPLQMSTAIANGSSKTDGRAATAITLTLNSDIDDPFPEGTMIEIWGVDAIEEAE